MQQDVAVTFVAFRVYLKEYRATTKVQSLKTMQQLCVQTKYSIYTHYSETQLSRQITPRTKNGHAPPITQS